MQTASQNGSTKVKLILAWGFVGIPLVWGVLETIGNAMKLFH
ncbi:MAG TPA: hypothetical protein VMU69_31545 [Bradyrhizobium sp.]|nr:hypothetical protein [Bradyrhizobium sp.]